ncbi:unnamed protein product [Strongylus vulgaris]|uniref:glucuronosyltransferase n=1 Tax=Strongylus vulgaris TaxID=40348 RepID=A0A3P7JJ88_STRVU|nr:unnamed protein product [Strongylus vulgaris]
MLRAVASLDYLKLQAFGTALFEVLNITSTIAVTSNPYLDSLAYAIGEPMFPSYVPGLMSTTGDRMSFTQRLQNIVALIIGRAVANYMNDNEMAMLRHKYGTFKTHTELIAQTSYVFTNGNPYLDFPRPTLHKTVMVGGFAVSRKLKKSHALSEEWTSFLNAYRHTILVSFGSVAKSAEMPENFKKTLISVFASMPDVGFIWKYEEVNSTIVNLSNVFLSAWVPQIPLLESERLSAFLTHGGMGSCNEVAYMGKPIIVVNPVHQFVESERLSAFLTHGGMGSCNEVAYMGKPIIVIPIFGDQMRNAHMMARHGGAIVLDKSDLGDALKLKNAFKEIIKNPRYAENAFRLSQMLRNQPIPPDELLLKHAEFAAKFGRLSNLDSYGRHLSVIQYFLIDLVAVVFTIMALILLMFSVLIRKCCCARSSKIKSE